MPDPSLPAVLPKRRPDGAVKVQVSAAAGGPHRVGAGPGLFGALAERLEGRGALRRFLLAFRDIEVDDDDSARAGRDADAVRGLRPAPVDQLDFGGRPLLRLHMGVSAAASR